MRQLPEILGDYAEVIGKLTALAKEFAGAQKDLVLYPELAAQLCAAGVETERFGRSLWLLGDALGRLDGTPPAQEATP